MGSLPARTQKKGWGSTNYYDWANPHPNSMFARLKRAEQKKLLEEKNHYELESKSLERGYSQAAGMR